MIIFFFLVNHQHQDKSSCKYMVWKKIDVPVSPLQEGPAGIVTQRIEEMEDHTSFPMIFFTEEKRRDPICKEHKLVPDQIFLHTIQLTLAPHQKGTYTNIPIWIVQCIYST